ncbi:MAG TPA: hypothetical protein VGC23_08345 [Vicinamibacterales bacterium]
MAITSQSKSAIGAAIALLLFGAASDASARTSCQAVSAAPSEVNSILATYGSRVIAVGRVDAVSRGLGIQVLGLRVIPSAGDNFHIGDYAAVIDWSHAGSKNRLLEARPLVGRYVPGVSEVYLRSKPISNDALRGHLKLGTVDVDYTNSPNIDHVGSWKRELAIRGTQPQPNGVVLSSCVTLRREGSLGTGKVEGSLGTGKTDGSLGTGRLSGSLGTGRTEGSLGTGKTAQ